MDDHEYIGHVWEHGLGLAAAAERAGLESRVPSCPEWSVADLVWHLTEVQHFWRWIVDDCTLDPTGYVEPPRPAEDDLLAACRAGVDLIVSTLRNADPADPVWSWAPRGQSVGWVIRRQAHEAAMHRWDAEAAAGTAWSIPTDLAVDGIDEFFDHFTDAPAKGAATIDGTIHLHCTDGDGEWLVAEPDTLGPLQVTREHAKGDAAVRGGASDLLLLLWRRIGLDTDGGRFELFGDRAVVDRLVARTSLS